MGKVKRLELWWQLYRTSLPVWDLENFRPMDVCWRECTSVFHCQHCTLLFIYRRYLIISKWTPFLSLSLSLSLSHPHTHTHTQSELNNKAQRNKKIVQLMSRVSINGADGSRHVLNWRKFAYREDWTHAVASLMSICPIQSRPKRHIEKRWTDPWTFTCLLYSLADIHRDPRFSLHFRYCVNVHSVVRCVM